MMIPEVNFIDLASIVSSEGVSLRKAGGRLVGLCPFHSEKTPSFFVFPDNHFRCFGCGAHGDAADFMQKLHGIGFKEALTLLGIEKKAPSPEIAKKIKKAERKRSLTTAFREWQRRAVDEIQTLLRCSYKLIREIRTLQDVESRAFLFHSLPELEYHLSILISGANNDKLKLFEENLYG